MTDPPTPATEKAGLDAKGLAVATMRMQGISRLRHISPIDAADIIRAYLEATPDAQYRRGAEDMKRDAIAALNVENGSPFYLALARIRPLPIPTPDEGERT